MYKEERQTMQNGTGIPTRVVSITVTMIIEDCHPVIVSAIDPGFRRPPRSCPLCYQMSAVAPTPTPTFAAAVAPSTSNVSTNRRLSIHSWASIHSRTSIGCRAFIGSRFFICGWSTVGRRVSVCCWSAIGRWASICGRSTVGRRASVCVRAPICSWTSICVRASTLTCASKRGRAYGCSDGRDNARNCSAHGYALSCCKCTSNCDVTNTSLYTGCDCA